MANIAVNHQQPDLPEHIQAFFYPDTYSHDTSEITLLQTHISWVFLTGMYVYKIKKPVNFGFLDFSTLEKRKFYCEQELHLNQKLAPELYLEVLPVCQFQGRYNLYGKGVVVDYCLKMVQFEQQDLFDKRLDRRMFQPLWMDQLADDIANFHLQAQVNSSRFEAVQALQEHITGNLHTVKKHLAHVMTQQQFKALTAFAGEMLRQKRAVLEQRARHIRFCHGDLHFRNITLFNNRATVFDCIEFNDDFRLIDTMNDVAFLVMDCDAHARPELGFRFLSRYLELTEDYAGLELLPLYLFYRAGVRGKVACLSAEGLPVGQQEAYWQEAKQYFDLALAYTARRAARLFAVGGLSGSGKSHLALTGCGVEQAIVLRSDAIRKQLAKLYPEWELYGDQMSEKTYQTLFEKASVVLDAGYSVILDATFLEHKRRLQVRALSEESGCRLRFYWLDMDENVLTERVMRRSSTLQDISDADLSVLHKQMAHYQLPAEPWIEVIHSSEVWPR